VVPALVWPQIEASSPMRWITCSLQTRVKMFGRRGDGIGGAVRVGWGVPRRIGVAEANREPGGVTNDAGVGRIAAAGRGVALGTGERGGRGVGLGGPSASGVGETTELGEPAAAGAGDAAGTGDAPTIGETAGGTVGMPGVCSCAGASSP
jgi:hypothetical protein